MSSLELDRRYGFPNTPGDYNAKMMGDGMCIPVDDMLGSLSDIHPHSGLKFIAIGPKDDVLGAREIWIGYDSDVPHYHLLEVALKETHLPNAVIVDAGAIITKDNSHEWYIAGSSDMQQSDVSDAIANLQGNYEERMATTRALTAAKLQRKGEVYGLHFINGRPLGPIW